MVQMTTCDLHNETIVRLQRELAQARANGGAYRKDYLLSQDRLKKAEAENKALREDAERNRRGLALILDSLLINSDNIGSIRRNLLLPIDCVWNAWVRDLTAERENQPPVHPDDLRAAIDAARKG